MESLLYNISQVLGITIIHSLWQGLLIYFVLRLLLLSMPSLPSVKKYNLAAIALLSMAVWFIYTFCTEAKIYNWGQAPGTYPSQFIDAINFQGVAHESFKTTLYTLIKNYLPYISILYTIGLVFNLGKLGLAWNKIRVIKKGMITADNLQQRITDISKQLNIKRYVKVSFSRLVDVPCVIGYFKPILLLPITLTFQLSAEEIETILLHELSHIKGNDFLVNLVQQIISVLLFFNPFAQLINQIISTEREHRCDDIVVQNTQNRLTYAYALLKLEETRQGHLQLALAATQNKHHLLTRIERIMNTKTPIGNIRPILLAVLLIAGSLSSIAWLNPEIKNGKITFKNIPVVPKPSPPAAPVPPVAALAPPAVVAPPKKDLTVSYDTVRHSQPINDTTKKKIKIVVEDENGNKKEYNSVKDMPESLRKDFYEGNANDDFNFGFRFNNDSTFNRAMAGRFNSADFKKQMEAMQDMGLDMNKKFNDPAFKKQMEAMKAQGEKMKEYFNSPKGKKQVEDMKMQGEKMAKYYNSPEWKKMQEDMKLKGEKMEEYYNGPEWKKQMEDMKKQGEDMAKYYNGPEWKKQAEEFAKQGAEMAKYYDSPEWKKQVEEFARQGEEFAKQFGGDDWKIRRKIKEDDMNADDHTRKMIDKKVEKTTKKAVKTEVKEKKEAVEKAEKKEAKEKPEQKEKPDPNN